MKRNFLAGLAAALAMISGFASAESFTLNISGPGFHTISDCDPAGWGCMPATSWFGTLTIDVSNPADGTYSGADVPLITLDTNLYSFTLVPATDLNCCDNVSVTMSGGIPGDVEIGYRPSDFEHFVVDGRHANFEVDLVGRGGPFPFAGGDATVFGVPEPTESALLLAGLALLALRSRGASACSGRSPSPELS